MLRKTKHRYSLGKVARTSPKRLDGGLLPLRMSIHRQENTQRIIYLIFYVTTLLHLCSINLENNFFLTYYFTFVNSSVTLINNYIN